jgi:hypothetical protein
VERNAFTNKNSTSVPLKIFFAVPFFSTAQSPLAPGFKGAYSPDK